MIKVKWRMKMLFIINKSKLYIDSDSLLCCDSDQIIRMEDGFQQADGIFGRCQTCIKNMQKSICSFTCAPDQSRFMTPTIVDSWDGTGNILIIK